MRIQWFPGHMTKALREMQANLKMIDVVAYVLDARAPLSCINPRFRALTNKPFVFLLNKKDLADAGKVNDFKNFFLNQGIACLAVTSTASGERNAISSAIMSVAKPIIDKYKQKGVTKVIRAMVIGVPNSGKSTLINCLATKKTALTGNKPGVTKGQQWVRLDNGLELLDTPGTLWPKFDDENVAKHLAYIGSIKDDVVDVVEVATLFIEEIVTLYPDALTLRYGIEVLPNSKDTLDAIAKKRGMLLTGGVCDELRAAKTVLDDFRKGKLGNITLESPKTL